MTTSSQPLPTEAVRRNPKPKGKQDQRKRSEYAVQRPEQSVFLYFSGVTVTILRVTEEVGQYYHINTNEAATAEQQIAAALAEALRGCRPGHQIFVYTNGNAAAQNMIREWISPRQFARRNQDSQKPKNDKPRPKIIDTVIRSGNLSLSTGSISYLAPVWQNLVMQASQQALPELNKLVNYEIHTYAVTDGLRTYAGGILYGSGQIYLHSDHLRVANYDTVQEDLKVAEMTALEGVLRHLPKGTTVELHHTDPNLERFWNDTDDFMQEHPDIRPIAEKIANHINRDIRFETPPNKRTTAISSAARTLVSRSLNNTGKSR